MGVHFATPWRRRVAEGRVIGKRGKRVTDHLVFLFQAGKIRSVQFMTRSEPAPSKANPATSGRTVPL